MDLVPIVKSDQELVAATLNDRHSFSAIIERYQYQYEGMLFVLVVLMNTIRRMFYRRFFSNAMYILMTMILVSSSLHGCTELLTTKR